MEGFALVKFQVFQGLRIVTNVWKRVRSLPGEVTTALICVSVYFDQQFISDP